MAKAPSNSNDFAPPWLNFADNTYSKKPNGTSVIPPRKYADSKERIQVNPQTKNNLKLDGIRNSISQQLDSEFPSLNDNTTLTQNHCHLNSPKSSGSSVWSKPPSLKSIRSQDVHTETKLSSAIYKSLVPKNNLNQSKAYKRSLSSPSWSPNSSKTKENIFKNSPPVLYCPSDYVSNIQVLSKTKYYQRKAKNDFLTEMRQNNEEGSNVGKQCVSESKLIPYSAKQHSMTLDDESKLSSSLEAEHRLLKQMGWSSGDEQPLTDEEIKEYFRNNEISANNSFGLQVDRKQQLIEALADWSSPNSQKSTKSENISTDHSADLIFENKSEICSTDSDLSSLEDD